MGLFSKVEDYSTPLEKPKEEDNETFELKINHSHGETYEFILLVKDKHKVIDIINKLLSGSTISTSFTDADDDMIMLSTKLIQESIITLIF